MEPIERLNAFINSAIPYAWDDSESWFEFLAKVLKKVNELIEKTNEYFSVDLSKYVEDVLTVWKDDGTLDQILNQTIFADLNERVETNTTNITETKEKVDNRLSRFVVADEVGLTSYATIEEAEQNADADGNAAKLQPYLDSGYTNILFLKNKFYGFETSLKMRSNTLLGGVIKGSYSTLVFPNGKGLVFPFPGYYMGFEYKGLSIVSNDNCIDFKNDGVTFPNNVHSFKMTDLVLNSKNANCIYAGNNTGIGGDFLVFESVFDGLRFTAPNGAGIYGVGGLNNTFKRCQDMVAIKYVFQNCDGTFEDINTSFANATHFLFVDNNAKANYGAKLIFRNCNMEGLKESAIRSYVATVYYAFVLFENVTFVLDTSVYTPPVTFFPFEFFSTAKLILNNYSVQAAGPHSYNNYINPTVVTGHFKLSGYGPKPLVLGANNIKIKFGDYTYTFNEGGAYSESMFAAYFGKRAIRQETEIHASAIRAGRRKISYTTPATANLALQGVDVLYDVLKLTADANVGVNTLGPEYNTENGTVVTIQNISDYVITLAHGYLADGKMMFLGGENVSLNKNDNVTMIYDNVVKAWYQIETAITPKSGNTASRPTKKYRGCTYYNTTTQKLEVWNGTSWVDVVPSTP